MLATLTMLFAMVLVLPVNTAAQGGGRGVSDDAQRCRDGGWQSIEGYAFRNQGECISYVARGGTFTTEPEEPEAFLRITITGSCGTSCAEYLVEGSGLLPGSEVRAEYGVVTGLIVVIGVVDDDGTFSATGEELWLCGSEYHLFGTAADGSAIEVPFTNPC
jgi:hypothetical protein